MSKMIRKLLRKIDDEDDLYTDLTERQEEILSYIENCIADGLPPTRKEMAAHFGWKSPNAADEHLRALARKGRIELGRSPRLIKLRVPDEDARPE